MRDSNSKSISSNKAAVSITSSVYDRRALDCTEDKPLINSLNHLTFLASSSHKVREALAQDGGLERLVDILYEAQKPKNDLEKCVFAWKWVLSFQCLVLVGTRGQESIRKRLVDAGMIPIIATILDNYIISKKLSWATPSPSGSATVGSPTNPRSTAVANNTENSDNNVLTPTVTPTGPMPTNNLSVPSNLDTTTHTGARAASQPMIDDTITEAQIDSVFEQVTNLLDQADQTISETELAIERHENRKNNLRRKNNGGNNEEPVDEEYIKVLKSLNYLRFLNRLNIEDPTKIDKDFLKEFDELTKNDIYGNQMANSQEISNLLTMNDELPPPFFKRYEEKLSQSIPRNFENGILIPKEDDVIWSLQVLAFISKYTGMRKQLSETYIVNGLSLRTFNNSPPPLEMDNNEDTDYIEDDLNEYLINQPEISIGADIIQEQTKYRLHEDEDEVPLDDQTLQAEYDSTMKSIENDSRSKYKYMVNSYKGFLSEPDRIVKATRLEKFALDISRFAHRELTDLRIKNGIIYKTNLQNYSDRWNYNANWDNFDMDINNDNIDQNILPIKRLNIFPLVEKFTVRHLYSKDINYWAAVIVRNSNRKDESMCGRRQCAYFGCGKWEERPRQFAKCRRCKRAKYCSKECQSKAWTYHKYWCNAANSSSSTGTGSTAARPVSTATVAAGVQQSDPRRQVHHYHHHQEDHSHERSQQEDHMEGRSNATRPAENEQEQEQSQVDVNYRYDQMIE